MAHSFEGEVSDSGKSFAQIVASVVGLFPDQGISLPEDWEVILETLQEGQGAISLWEEGASYVSAQKERSESGGFLYNSEIYTRTLDLNLSSGIELIVCDVYEVDHGACDSYSRIEWRLDSADEEKGRELSQQLEQLFSGG